MLLSLEGEGGIVDAEALDSERTSGLLVSLSMEGEGGVMDAEALDST